MASIAVLLCLASIGFLMFFINHVAHSIQAEVIINRVTKEALAVVDHLFPEDPVSYDHAVLLAFPQHRHHGATNPAVAVRIARALVQLADRLPPDRREGVLNEIEELRKAAKRGIESESDLERVLAAATRPADPGAP